MTETNKKRMSFLVEDDDSDGAADAPESTQDKLEKLKKPVIFTLMAFAFLACMYWLFKPSSEPKDGHKRGINDSVPQATDAGMQSDKQKAYEQALLEKKQQQQKEGLMALSDYWNEQDSSAADTAGEQLAANKEQMENQSGNNALNSYRNIQNELGSFYKDNNSEADELRRQVETLKQELEEKSAPQPYNMDNQLALMEKSYEMASKYFPTGTQQTAGAPKDTNDKRDPKPPAIPMYASKNNAVSILHKEPVDNDQLESWNENRNMRFFTVGSQEKAATAGNSIKACIHETQTVTVDNGVRIRLLQDAAIAGMVIPKGHLLTAIAKFQGNRLQLAITSVEYNGNILPVEITAYDTDGQAGLYVPYSPERSALTEVVANMGTNAGTSVSLSSTPGQQIASDLSRSAVQGMSGYFAKKVRTPKVTLKTGHRLLLVSKK